MLARLFSALRRKAGPLPEVRDDMPEYGEILRAVEEQVRMELEPMPVQIGYDHAFNEAKRRILREKYGLRWRP